MVTEWQFRRAGPWIIIHVVRGSSRAPPCMHAIKIAKNRYKRYYIPQSTAPLAVSFFTFSSKARILQFDRAAALQCNARIILAGRDGRPAADVMLSPRCRVS